MSTIVILLAEDDAILRNLLEEGLGDAGFELAIKGSGLEAIAALDEHVGVFQAVITDIQLGNGPSGWDVGRHARELNPDIPVVYMSGDSVGDWSSKGVPGSVIIPKPFVIAQIVTAIATLLNKDSV